MFCYSVCRSFTNHQNWSSVVLGLLILYLDGSVQLHLYCLYQIVVYGLWLQQTVSLLPPFNILLSSCLGHPAILCSHVAGLCTRITGVPKIQQSKLIGQTQAERKGVLCCLFLKLGILKQKKILWSALTCSVSLMLLSQDSAPRYSSLLDSRWDRADLSSEDQMSSLTHSSGAAHTTGEHCAASTHVRTYLQGGSAPAPGIQIRDMKRFSCTGSKKNILESWLNIFFTKFLRWKTFWVEQIHREFFVNTDIWEVSIKS